MVAARVFTTAVTEKDYRTGSGSDRMQISSWLPSDADFRVFNVDLRIPSLRLGVLYQAIARSAAGSLRVVVFNARAQLTLRIEWPYRSASLIVAHQDLDPAFGLSQTFLALT